HCLPATATTVRYPLSLHDALPIFSEFFDHVAIAGEMGVAKPDPVMFHKVCCALGCEPANAVHVGDKLATDAVGARDADVYGVGRSEEHTSELQSRENLVCRLLLEK